MNLYKIFILLFASNFRYNTLHYTNKVLGHALMMTNVKLQILTTEIKCLLGFYSVNTILVHKKIGRNKSYLQSF